MRWKLSRRFNDFSVDRISKRHVMQYPTLPPGEDFVRQWLLTTLPFRKWRHLRREADLSAEIIICTCCPTKWLLAEVEKAAGHRLCCREMLWIVPLSACRWVHSSIISLLWQGLYWKMYLLKFKQHSALTSVQQDGCWCSKTNCMCKNDLATGCKMASFHQIPSQLREHRIWWMWMQRSFIAATSPWTTKGNCCCYFMSSCPWRTGVGSPRALLPTDYNNAKELPSNVHQRGLSLKVCVEPTHGHKGW